MAVPSSSAIFDRFLRRAVVITDRLDLGILHRIFYETSQVSGHALDSFEFLFRTRPYSPTLDAEIWAFKHSDRLSEDPETGSLIIRNGGRPVPTDDEKTCEQVVLTLIKLLERELSAVPTQGGAR